MKIVYILPSLGKMGGAERIIAEKANYFSRHFGFDISFINLFQEEGTPNIYPLSDSIRQINLGIQYHIQYRYKYPKRLLVKLKTYYDIHKRLTQLVNSISPDLIIGVSYSMADFVCTIPCKAKKIIECHEPRSLVLSNIYNGSFISKLYAKWGYIKTIEKKADLVVTLTNEDKLEWYKAKRTVVIPNFSTMDIIQYSTCEKKKVIAVGRLNPEKGFDRLIQIWMSVSKKHPDWQLDIFGDGDVREQLADIINTNNVKNISLQGSTQNISQEYANSSICAVTSYYEGFSLVILEAMKHGVPCVAFDCPYGPRNIIKDKKNGFLAEDGNISQFIERICELIEDNHLRQQYSESAKMRAHDFNVDKIMNQWKTIFEEIV